MTTHAETLRGRIQELAERDGEPGEIETRCKHLAEPGIGGPLGAGRRRFEGLG